jgi:hypothetical protein
MTKPFHNVVHALELDLGILRDQMRQAKNEGRDEDFSRLADKVLEFDEAVRLLRYGTWTIDCGLKAGAGARFAGARVAEEGQG